MGLRDWPQFWNNSNPIKLKSSWILELFLLVLLRKKNNFRVLKLSNALDVQLTGRKEKILLWNRSRRNRSISQKEVLEPSPNKSRLTVFSISLTHQLFLMIQMLKWMRTPRYKKSVKKLNILYFFNKVWLFCTNFYHISILQHMKPHSFL